MKDSLTQHQLCWFAKLFETDDLPIRCRPPKPMLVLLPEFPLGLMGVNDYVMSNEFLVARAYSLSMIALHIPLPANPIILSLRLFGVF